MQKSTKFFIASALCLALLGGTAKGQPYEKLDRGFVAVKVSSGVFLSWRYLGTDDSKVSFNIYRNGELITATPLTTKTNYQDAGGNLNSQYELEVLDANGASIEKSPLTTGAIWASQGLTIPLKTPDPMKCEDGETCTYNPNDITVIDVDGDGQYELILKWDPSNSHDNSQGGYTGTVYIDCIKLDGTLMWRLDLGRNIRAGAHYTQMLAYDFNNDGKGELMIKTAPGTKDGKGNFVSQAADLDEIKNVDDTKSHVTSAGRINSGQEWLTVFNGETGEAIHTVFYNPNRNGGLGGDAAGTKNWDTRSGKSDTGSYGNRGERYLGGVAHLQGLDKPASAVFTRGMYTYAYLWAVDFDGAKLSTRWFHASENGTTYTVTDANGEKQSYTAAANTSGRAGGSNTMFGNGNHNMTIGDVDGDGKDEVVWGSAALDDDGKVLYATGFGHGDAIHMGNFDPSRPGMEVFQIHEEKLDASLGCWDLHDAATGKVLHHGGSGGVDNGRGICAQLSSTDYCAYFSSSDDRQQRSATTGEVASTSGTSVNGRIYWNGTLQDQLLDGAKIDAWNGNGTSNIVTLSGNTCNSTKNTPCFSGDILGDWREEVILWNAPSDTERNLVVYTTTITTNYRVVTLPHDHTYRMAMAWQNVGYNQPPHIGYFLPDLFLTKARLYLASGSGKATQTVELGAPITSIIYKWKFAQTVEVSELPEGLTANIDNENMQVVISGTTTAIGSKSFTIKTTGMDSGLEANSVTCKITTTRPTILALSSGTLSQAVDQGAALTNIVISYKFASGATVEGLPDGVTATVDSEAKTITISGKPSTAGKYTYTVTPVDVEEGLTANTLKGVITVNALDTMTLLASFSFDNSLLNAVPNSEATAVGFTPSYSAGRSGNAIVFDGTAASRVAQAHYDQMTISNQSFTISLWINSTMPSTADSYLFHKGSTTANASTGATGKWIGIEYKKGNLYFAIDDDVTKTQCAYSDAAKYLDGAWHNIVCIRNVADKKLYMYIDGALVASSDDKTGDISQTEEMVLGNSTVNFDCPYTGMMDEVMIFNGAMKEAQVQEIYSGTNALHNIKSSSAEWVKLQGTSLSEGASLAFDTYAQNVSISAVNMSAKPMAAKSLKIKGNEVVELDDFAALPNGIYVLVVKGESETYSAKVVR